MDWGLELSRTALHAAVAAALVLALAFPGRRVVAAAVARVAAMPRGRAVLLAVVATVAVRGALFPAVHPVYETDVAEYCEKAAAIARDGHPRAQETRADGTRFYRTLGWSLPLAGVYRAAGIPETPDARVRAAQALGVVLAGAIAAMLVLLGAAIGFETAGRLAALGYAAYLPAAMFSLVPYAETWAAFLVVASALAFQRLRGAQGPRAASLAAALGVLQGLLVITRTEFAWMPLLAAAWLVWERRARAAVPAALVLALTAGPLAVNHALRAGYPGTLRTSVQGGLILHFGNNPIEVTGHGNASPPVVAHVQALYAKDPTGALARDEALAWMRAHPGEVVANAPKKLHFLWLAEPQGFSWQVGAGRAGGSDATLLWWLRHAAWVQSLALLGLGIAGLAKRPPGTGFWIAALALHAATWSVLAASPRNRYPLEPLLLVAAAFTATTFTTETRRRGEKSRRVAEG